MSKIIYEHNHEYQTVIELDPMMITTCQMLGMDAFKEIFEVIKAEMQTDAITTVQMSKIIYEHNHGHQTVMELDPMMITKCQMLGMDAFKEIFEVIKAEMQTDAITTVQGTP